MVEMRNFIETKLIHKKKLTNFFTYKLTDKKKRFVKFSLLSGEIYKKNFTDIFNTTFEQVAFSLDASDSINQKDNKTLRLSSNTSFRFRKGFAFTGCLQRQALFNLFKKGVEGDDKRRKVSCRPLFYKPKETFNKASSTNRSFVKTALCLQMPQSKRKSKALTVPCLYKDLYKPKQSFVHITTPSIEAMPTKLRFVDRKHIKPQTLKKKVLFLEHKNQIKSLHELNKTSFTVGSGMNTQAKFYKKEKREPSLCLQKTSKTLPLQIKIGDYVTQGDKIYKPIASNRAASKIFVKKIPLISGTTGKIVRISKTQITFQKVQPILFYSNANLHVKNGDWVERGSPILTLTHQTLITGDIVQGIPRIEQLFEAFTSPPAGIKDTNNLHNTLHTQVRDIFRRAWFKNVLPIAVRQSLEEIQQILVESIQKVYLSQGVLIADKHIEIIVRQMTSKVEVLDAGSTGLLIEEVLNIKQIENANLTTPGQKALYVPAVVGITQAALGSDSFISAASFQETTRVLSRDAVIGKSDFLRGLKEKVVIGDLISAGTGLEIYFVYNLLPHKLNSIES